MNPFFVTGCADCPMRNEDSEQGDACNHPKGERQIPYFTLPWPEQYGFILESCPLKEQPITLLLTPQ